MKAKINKLSMNEENEILEKKSLRMFEGNNPPWRELARECVCFANARGGKIVIGIEDKEELPPIGQKIPENLPEQIRKRVNELTINVGIYVRTMVAPNNAQYIDLTVYPSKSSVASTTDGQYYIRIADHCRPVLPDDLSRLFTDKPAYQWETKVVVKKHWKDCDTGKLKQFLDEINASERVSTFVKQKSEEEILFFYQFIDEKGYLTNLGTLWIGTRQQRAQLLYAPAIQFIKYNHRNEKIKKVLWDDFSLNPKEMIESVWEKIPDWKEGIEISEGILGRRTIYHFNENVVRELLANALAHRPYTTRGDIFINLYPDRLEIHNPGLLPLGVTPQNILHLSVKRNEHLSKVFYDLGLMEREGSGYDKIFEIQVSEAKALPVVEEGNDRVSVTIFNQIKRPAIVHFIEEVKKQIPLNQKEIICLGIIAQHELILATEFARLIQSQNDRQIKNWVGKLMDYNIVSSKGRTKGTQYFINPRILKDTGYLQRTSLKQIPEHQLEALVITDVERFGNSSISQIHERIGKEIPLRKLRTVLYKMVKENKLLAKGVKRGRTYFIDKNR